MNDTMDPVENQPAKINEPVTPPVVRSVMTTTPPQRSGSGKWAAVIVAILIVGGLMAGAYWLGNDQQDDQSVTVRQATANDGNKIVTAEEESIAQVVSKVSPSVVSIVTKIGGTESLYGRTQASEGAGTGIIVGKDGYVLTNKHVIDGASTVQVVLTDGTRYSDVKVLGTDPLNDVAFLQIPNVSNLPIAELGDSTSIRVGQRVIAIGNSLGQYQNTVTSGIISGTGRPIAAQAGNAVESLTDLIQTDAAINPGNSGGPLLNLQGQVVGINTAIIENAQGIGFSIPIGATKGILKGVLAGKGVQRAYLGVNYVPITADAANEYKLPVKKGAYIYNGEGKTAVSAGSPADKAGIKDKDIITKIGDIEVGDRGGVASLVAEYAPGDTIEISILRDGKTLLKKISLVAYPQQ